MCVGGGDGDALCLLTAAHAWCYLHCQATLSPLWWQQRHQNSHVQLLIHMSLLATFCALCALTVQVGLLAYRYKFGPPTEQPKAGQRLLQQVGGTWCSIAVAMRCGQRSGCCSGVWRCGCSVMCGMRWRRSSVRATWTDERVSQLVRTNTD